MLSNHRSFRRVRSEAWSPTPIYLLSPLSYDLPIASKSTRNLPRVSPRVHRSFAGRLIWLPTASVC